MTNKQQMLELARPVESLTRCREWYAKHGPRAQAKDTDR